MEDSLEIHTSQIRADSLKLEYIFDKSYHYYQEGDSAKFRFWNKLSKYLSERSVNNDRVAESYWDLGNFMYRQNVPDSAYFNYFKAYQFYKKNRNNFYSARMLLNMGILQENFKDFVGSEVATVEALKTFEELNKKPQLYIGYSNLGVVFNGLKDIENSLEFHRKALEVAKSLNNSILISKTLNNIGAVYSNEEDYDSAQLFFRKAMKTDSLPFKDPALYATLIDNLTFTEFKTNPNANLIIKNYKKALGIHDSIENIPGIILSNIHLGEYYIFHGNDTTAQNYFLTANEFARETSNFDYYLESLKLLESVNPKDNGGYLETYLQINDSLVREERKIRNKFARIRYRTDQYIQETKILSQQRIYLLGLITLFIISFVATFFYIKQRIKNKELTLIQEQQEANEKIYDLLLEQHKHLETGKINERERIANELHDGVLGKIFGTRMSIGFLNPMNTVSIEPYLQELQNIEKEIRDISHNLMDKITGVDEKFISILKTLIQDKQKIFGLHIQFHLDENLDLEVLPTQIQINLYRILQEAIQNVIKHADSKTLYIAFFLQKDILELNIRDEGKGFKKSKKKAGLGLKSMRNRASNIGGKLIINSSEMGTELVLKIKYTSKG
ncbi:tetratricopeptide repeat protein [Christiangramia sp. LLG6405-1]|uniref:tetratricopeptide repeat-containing sensor histidine kinase n=1 Tax=Christiangramia sp. LLG6405-1 TaxID=3160832 RepID=UPI00386F2838